MRTNLSGIYIYGDLKVIYALTGGIGAFSSFLCPYCANTLDNMENSQREIQKLRSATILQSISRIRNLIEMPAHDNWKRGKTFNLFRLLSSENNGI